MNKTLLKWIVNAIAMSGLLVSMSAVQAQAGSEEAKLIEGLKVYNALLEKQIAAQKVAKQEIQTSIQQSKGLERQISRVLNDMLASLESFVKSDLPFHKADRIASIELLKSQMTDSQVKPSERFRNIMDIYNAELEYGNTYEAYPDTVTIDGVETPVDVLRVGRLALYYQTKNQKNSGMYDAATKSWKALPSDSNRSIRTAIKVASKSVAPKLLELPINAPEGV